MNTRAGGDDINDRIHGSHFVKVNLFDRHVMNLCLRMAQEFESADGSSLNFLVQQRALDEIPNDPQGTTVPMIDRPREALRLVYSILAVAVWNARLMHVLGLRLCVVGSLSLLGGVMVFLRLSASVAMG